MRNLVITLLVLVSSVAFGQRTDYFKDVVVRNDLKVDSIFSYTGNSVFVEGLEIDCVENLTYFQADSLADIKRLNNNCNYFITDKYVLLTPLNDSIFDYKGAYYDSVLGRWDYVEYLFEDSLITARADIYGNRVYMSKQFFDAYGFSLIDSFEFANSDFLRDNFVYDVVFYRGSLPCMSNVVSSVTSPLVPSYCVVDASSNTGLFLNNIVKSYGSESYEFSGSGAKTSNEFIYAASSTVNTSATFNGNNIRDNSSINITGAASLSDNILLGSSTATLTDNSICNGTSSRNGNIINLAGDSWVSNGTFSASIINSDVASGTSASTDMNAVGGKIILEDSSSCPGCFVYGRGGYNAELILKGNSFMGGASVFQQIVVCDTGFFSDRVILPQDGVDTFFVTPNNQSNTILGSTQIIDGNESNGYVLTSNASGNATWQPKLALDSINCYLGTGWVSIFDNTTSYTIAANDTQTILIAQDVVVDQQTPCGWTADSFYSSVDSVILGREGDAYIISLDWETTQNTNNATEFKWWIDIGGAVGRIYPTTYEQSKGIGVTKSYNKTTWVYTLDTWQANGGKIQFTTNQSIDIDNVRINVQRLYKAP